jgi:hypothetical protein
MKTPLIVNVLKVVGGLGVFVGLVYGAGALRNTIDMADPSFLDKYRDIAAQYTAERDHDTMVSICAFGSSILIFGFASSVGSMADG